MSTLLPHLPKSEGVQFFTISMCSNPLLNNESCINTVISHHLHKLNLWLELHHLCNTLTCHYRLTQFELKVLNPHTLDCRPTTLHCVCTLTQFILASFLPHVSSCSDYINLPVSAASLDHHYAVPSIIKALIPKGPDDDHSTGSGSD